MAVFTPVTLEQAAAFWQAYERGELLSLTPIAEGTENSNFFAADKGGEYVLTLFERRVDPAALPYFVTIMQDLSQRGFPCPVPLLMPNAQALRQLCGRPALAVGRLSGASSKQPSPTQTQAAGAVLAHLHTSGVGAPLRANPLGVAALRRLAEELEAPEAAEALAFETDGLSCGLIHADYFPDNVLLQGDDVSGVIDFYFACTDAWAYDVAIALTAWALDEHGRPDDEQAAAFLAGYESSLPLDAHERAALPALCRRAAARFYLTRLYDLRHPRHEALLTPKDPEVYRRKLAFLQENPSWPIT